ncbi:MULTISPECIES: MFS transporter [unclassified Methanoregula]|uniref:MFS transporter n=1 Tax=unclassified Methanoregula TaxID=2649730 RepID=UPI0009CDFD51|nr:MULTISPECIES: MFS transporter [unclassified Methanoregula]OPX62837.1 MAG: putative transporter [Methanoregula sp. PtaB.Bin085]OPY35274.1 MAG: putative transporter [Methanoregula sp. PtaU1.Bin006]
MPDGNAQKTALFIAILAGFITPFDLSAVNIALPSLAGEFSMDALQMGWVSTAYLLASAVFLVPFGRIADIHGRRKVFFAGLAIFTSASFLMIFAPSGLAVILLRVLQGFGSAMIFGTAIAILTSVTPPDHRGRVLGIYTTSVYLGLSMGPFLGGFLTGTFGWRSIFFVNIPLGLLALAMIWLYLEGEWADCRGERFDLGGAIQYGLTLTCVMYGFSLLPDREGFILLVAGTVMLVVFIAREFRISYPLWNVRLFSGNRVFLFSNLAALINYGATFSVTFFLSLYFQYTMGFSPEQAGTILVVQPVVMACVSPLAGRLSDRIAPGKIASAGMALSALALVLLTFAENDTSLLHFIGILVIFGIGLGIFSSPNTNAVMSSVDRCSYGVASGTLGTMRLAGQMLSMGIAMMMLAVYIGNVQISPDVYPAFITAMKASMAIFAAMCIAGIFFSLVRYGKRPDSGACPP